MTQREKGHCGSILRKKKSPEIVTQKVQRRGLSKAQISGNTMSIRLKELTVDRGELSSTFFASALR